MITDFLAFAIGGLFGWFVLGPWLVKLFKLDEEKKDE